jgi:activator of HSP90 ATPase
MDKLKMSVVLNSTKEILFNAWLNYEEHAAFTGAGAVVDPKVGGKFTAWDAYISGTTIKLEPFNRIVQKWRTTEFPEDAPDSLLEILFEDAPKGCRLTLVHTEIPDGDGEMYREGWEDYYFKPMKEYYG